ncbi:hypothetical protein [Vibrio alginolyticus]|uniref:hypothetical protein n=1 Tax=Vibrio alginolyticus TaxID=663 RepID=UPI003F673E61
MWKSALMALVGGEHEYSNIELVKLELHPKLAELPARDVIASEAITKSVIN